jgi:hypothetical protein
MVKEAQLLFGLITLLFLITPLIIVHVLFKINSGSAWLSAEWEAGDVLGYIAGF